MADLDIVGGAGVDVVPVAPTFHTKLKAIVLPIADRVGEEAGRRMGEAISNNIVVAIPNAVNQGGNAAQRAATKQGNDTGGAFARSLRMKLEAAFKAMPKLDVRLSDTGVDAELARLRARMETLSGKRIGIDVDVARAEAEVKAIDEELKRLGASHPNVAVRADTATARAALAELRAEIAAVDEKKRVKIDVDTTGAQGAVMALAIQMGILTAIPLGPVLTAGLGALTAMVTTAGAGFGSLALVAIPAIKGVTTALQAKKAADDEASKATANGAAANGQAAQRALQMAGAQQALESAHRNAARNIAQANRQVEDAERAVAQASQRAADQRRQAAEAVERAEQSLADAKRAARRAEEDLTQAREDAARQLRDLNDNLAQGALDQREATLRVQKAQQDLQATLADPKATQLQRDEAQLTYEQAQLHAKQQAQDYKDLQKSAAEQRKAGVKGNEAVKTASERLADAQRNVIEQTKAVADAQRASARAQVEAAQTVADANRRVADAVENAANVQLSAAESIQSAERGVASARLSGMSATSKALTKQEEYRKAIAKLTPSQRELYDSIAGPTGVKSAFDAWQKSLQPHVLPLFTRGVDGAKASLPTLTPLVIGAADAIQTLMDKASAQLKTPFWQGFKKDLAGNVKPAIVGFGVAFGNVVKGVAGIIDAFLPHMDGIAKKSDSITARFAKWGTSLKGSPNFEKFLAYVKETSPGLAEFLGKILEAALDVSKALAPLSETMFAVLGPVFDAISWLSENCPAFVQILWTVYFAQKAISLGMAAFAAAMALYEIVIAGATLVTSGWAVALNATGIVPLIRAIVIVIGLLIAAVIYAYNNWDWFRIAVDVTVDSIGKSLSWVWKTILQPVFSGIWTALKAVGDAAVWLWDHALGPAFSFIGKAAQWLLTAVVTIALLPIYLAVKAVGAIAMWLWDHAFGPAFGFIGDAASLLWKAILQPIFGWIGDKAKWLWEKAVGPALREIKRTFEALGDAAKWLWEKVLRPSFNFIGDKAKWLWEKALKPPFDKIKAAVGLVADSFGKAKDSIKSAWDKIEGIAKKPVKFIIEHVYNGGIVPLWNKVADITGAGKLKKLDLRAFHTGGVMPGYTPGHDNQIIAVGGGEAIMRPEWTRVVGEDTINSWNAAARSGGISGVRKAVAAGMPAFKDGGVVGWLKDKGNAVGNFFSGAADFLDPIKVFGKAKDFVKDQMKSLLTNPWARSLAEMPPKMLTALKDKALDFLGFGGGSGGGSWIKPVNAPYGTPFGKKGSMWSSGRHTGLDFPAAVGTIIKAVADGKVSQATGGGPYGNHVMINHGGGLASLYAHMSQMLTSVGKAVKQGQAIGRVGATGNVTGPHLHLEARRNGKAVDPMQYLTGGGGTTFNAKAVGSAQAYAKNILGNYGWGPEQFGPLKKLWEGESGWRWNALNPSSGAYGIPQALPAEKMRSAGADWRKNPATQIRWGLDYIKHRPDYGSPAAAWAKWQSRSPHWYDDGGYLPPGLNVVANGTGKPEPVFTSSQWDTLRANAGQGGGPTTVHADVKVYVGDREITDIVRTEIVTHEESTASAIDTGRWV
ncbi:peptidoglycan DD-metalloendopeptidase family protein [Streptomyces sp. CA-135486]|uniref:aggregation-promoting factor C-terminal-like domain-containing protein n=1 Tax=Streptomyces sp. CA-135486 TaxID=3240049 RepID=UPI003D8FA36A